MKIGIEASRLTEKQRTGTENYLYNLVKQFAKLDKENHYILYFREKPSLGLWNDLSQNNPRFSYKTVKKILSWTQVGLPIELFRETPDILFCTWHTMPGLNPFWKMKTISAFHDATARFIPSFWTAHFSHKVICVSERTKNEVIRRYAADPKKITVIYEGQGLDENLKPASAEEIMSVRKKYGIKKGYILFLSSLGPRKNLEKTVEAYSKLDPKIRDKFDFVMSGKIMTGSEELAQLPSKYEGVKYIGRSDDADLAGLYSGAAFLSFVSKEEGFGLPIIEANSFGTPVLASDILVMREIAGDSAIFVNPNYVEEISDGMEKLLTNENLRSDLIKKGFENVKRFSWENSARQIMEVFNGK